MFIIVLGLLSSIILFSKFPILKRKDLSKSSHKISVIIPARNEEKNIENLLKDLMKQTINIHEIICVDDGSSDETYKVALSFGVKVISIKDKPSDWTGKAWACQKGADAAGGDVLLFLDADVRLSPYALASLISSYHENKCVISVQPYHKMEKRYEQFSLFFNLIQIAGNGTSMRGKARNAGLYGPVILIDQVTYTSIDGHLSAKQSIVDDVALGGKLKQMGFDFKLFMGGEDITFRMYRDDFKSLFQGWTKNYATGASKSSALVFILVFLWVTSCTTSVINLGSSIVGLNLFLYICWVVELYRVSYPIGNFKKTTIIFFPIYLVFFIITFSVSVFKKLFTREVVWKDRKIKLD